MRARIKRFGRWRIAYINEAELNELEKELYTRKYYNWSTPKPNPVIFDVGALIGETVLYFKEQFPRARITAFEPSPRSFALLKRNVRLNRLTDVKLVNVAVGKGRGRLDFYIDKNANHPWGRGDSLKTTKSANPQTSRIVKVSVVKLSSYIRGDIDLLKIDIEGAETEVIREIEPKLKHVRQLILEYHESVYNPENKFPVIMQILKRQDFKTNIFLGKWPLPNLLVTPARIVLKLARVDEYWLRIYARQ